MSSEHVERLALSPLKVLGGDAQAVPLATGVNEAVASSLANLTGISLVTASSEANYHAIGSVQISGSRFRVTVKLLDFFVPSGLRFKSRSRANEKIIWGVHCQAMNTPVTSVVELRAHRMAIAACFVFQRKISRSVFWDFFDSIDPSRKSAF